VRQHSGEGWKRCVGGVQPPPFLSSLTGAKPSGLIGNDPADGCLERKSQLGECLFHTGARFSRNAAVASR